MKLAFTKDTVIGWGKLFLIIYDYWRIFKAGSHCLMQFEFEFTILLPQPSQWWDYKHVDHFWLWIVFWRLEAVVERGSVHDTDGGLLWFLRFWLFTLQYWLIFWLSQQKTLFVSTWSHLAGNCFLHAELIGVLNLSSQMILPMAAEEWWQ